MSYHVRLGRLKMQDWKLTDNNYMGWKMTDTLMKDS